VYNSITLIEQACERRIAEHAAETELEIQRLRRIHGKFVAAQREERDKRIRDLLQTKTERRLDHTGTSKEKDEFATPAPVDHRAPPSPSKRAISTSSSSSDIAMRDERCQ
jgi:hypothetical protein